MAESVRLDLVARSGRSFPTSALFVINLMRKQVDNGQLEAEEKAALAPFICVI
jgi:hypothetical protein